MIEEKNQTLVFTHLGSLSTAKISNLLRPFKYLLDYSPYQAPLHHIILLYTPAFCCVIAHIFSFKSPHLRLYKWFGETNVDNLLNFTYWTHL